MKIKELLIIFGIFILALGVRFYGIGWDNFQHLHPDERFLSMLISDISTPSTFFEYLNTNTSPLNPYNHENYKFFVYGTFPIFLIKYLSGLFGFDSYNQAFIFGRVFSIAFDSLNVISLYFLSRLVFKNKNKFVFLPSLFYCFLVLPIQQSHFFTVDTFLNTFLLLSFTLLCYSANSFKLFVLSAVFFGLAVSSKISGVFFIPVIFFYILFSKKNGLKVIRRFFRSAIFFLVSLLIFRLAQPYSFVGLFTPNPDFLNSLHLLSTYSKPDGFYPPSIVWISKTIILFPLQNIVLWGIGIPLFSLFLYGLLKNFFGSRHKFVSNLFSNKIILFSLIWIFFLFFYQGSRFSHNLRYFLPIYPFFCLVAVWFVSKIGNLKIIQISLGLHILWSLLFINIYTVPNTRIQASSWIYRNISEGSVLTAEYWDDALPLRLDSERNLSYTTKWLKLYDMESSEKWEAIRKDLADSDYVIMSSNRLWASIPKVPHMYPQTTKFYQDLFEERLEFKKYKEFNSYPGLTLPFFKKCIYIGYTDYPYKDQRNKFIEVDNDCLRPGIFLRDDTAEESFTVFDHPKVLIFSR